MPVRKTYMLKWFQTMQMHVVTGTRSVLVEFTSPASYNKNIKGTFSTSNPDVIAAIERHSGFNKEFYVLKEESADKVEEPVYRSNPLEVKKLREQTEKEQMLSEDQILALRLEKAEKEAPVKVAPVEEKTEEVVEVSQAEHDEPALPPEWNNKVVVSEAEVSNVQQAKEYLKKAYPEVTARMMLNKASVMKVAAEKGIKFTAIAE